MRIGILCPYSLTVDGGVQMQVLGLARELRARGLEARVLGPCDGPPPESFVTPLGNSLPTSANGSIAPLAPDPPAMFRTLQALAAERFDVVHLHEPLAPGPTLTAAVTHRYPTVGTFHAAGTSASYKLIKPWLLSWIKRIDHKVVVSKDALELVQSHLGGDYEVLFNGVGVEQIRRTAPIAQEPGEPPAIFFCGRHEERKGLSVLIEAFGRLDIDAQLWIASTGPDTARLTAQSAAGRADPVARSDHGRGEVRPPPSGRHLLRAVARWGVVRRRPDRGDGGRNHGGGEWARRIPQRRDARGRRVAQRAGRRRRAGCRACNGP